MWKFKWHGWQFAPLSIAMLFPCCVSGNHVLRKKKDVFKRTVRVRSRLVGRGGFATGQGRGCWNISEEMTNTALGMFSESRGIGVRG